MPADDRAVPVLDISVVIPVYGVEQTIAELVRRLQRTLSEGGWTFEIIAVDDRSPDRSGEILAGMQEEVPGLRLIRFARNFGQHSALSAGIERAQGRMIFTIDGDLEYAPEDLPKLIAKFEEGHDFVNGWRERNAEPLFRRRFPAAIFQLVARQVTGVRLRDYGSGLVGLDWRIGKQLSSFGEMRRFLKPLMASLASDPAEVPISHRRRDQGRSSYTFFKLISLALDLLMHFSRRTFQIVALLGACLSALGFVAGLLFLVFRFGFGIRFSDRTQIIISLAFATGMQFLVLGLLGEVLTSVHGRVSDHPFFVIAEDSGRPRSADAAEGTR